MPKAGRATAPFFGYRPAPAGPHPAWQFHRLELRPNFAPNRDEFPFQIQRTFVTFSEGPKGRQVIEDRLHTELIGRMVRAPQMLEVHVSETHLVRVRWAGTDLRNLCTAEANVGAGPDEYFGQFGLYCCGSDGVFRNASISLY